MGHRLSQWFSQWLSLGYPQAQPTQMLADWVGGVRLAEGLMAALRARGPCKEGCSFPWPVGLGGFGGVLQTEKLWV